MANKHSRRRSTFGATVSRFFSSIVRVRNPRDGTEKREAGRTNKDEVGGSPKSPAAAMGPASQESGTPLIESRVTTQPVQSKSVEDADPTPLRLTLGVSTQFAQAKASAAIDIVIGLDFGTSATKIVTRAPYVGGIAPYAVPIPESVRAEGNPHLWQTVIWVDSDGRYSPVPQTNAKPIANVKSRLMGGNHNNLSSFSAMAMVYAHGMPAWLISHTYLDMLGGGFLIQKRGCFAVLL